MATKPNDAADFSDVFAELKQILQVHASRLVVAADEPGNYYLNTSRIQKNKQPLFFGAVQIKKNYVTFHLFPIYVHPELLTNISPELKARMQGKACFNFKSSDPALFAKLARLTQAGFAAFEEKGWISPGTARKE